MDICFIKNEAGKWEVKPATEEDTLEDVSKNKIGIIVAGHIGHNQAEIVELLNRHSENIQAEIVIIKTEIPDQKLSLEALVQERNNQLLIEISKTCKEMSDIFFEERKKPQHPNIHYTPKTQKCKITSRKFIPRKK